MISPGKASSFGFFCCYTLVTFVLLMSATAVPTLLITGCTPAGSASSDNEGDDDDDDDDDNENSNNNDDNGNDNGGGGTANQVIAVIGDYGDDDDDTRAVADLVKSWSPDAIITTGDNDYSDGAFRGTFEGLELAVGQYFHEFIGNYMGDSGSGSATNRFFPTPGDHDWGDTCDNPEGLDDYLAYFTLPADNSGNERYYDFRMGDVHFFSIHSLDGCEPNGVTEDSPQATWVRDAALASDAAFKIAFFHNPPYSSGARHIGGGAHMRWPFDEWGINLVLSGDDHVYERIQRDGLIYVVNGVGGVELHEFVDTPVSGSQFQYADAFGALRLDVHDDRIVGNFFNVSGEIIDTFTITASSDGGGDEPATWYRPPLDATWQWQIQPDANGDINTSYDVDVYDIDLFDAPQSVIDALHADGRRVICYFSAGSFEDFRDDADQFMAAELGNTLDGFADERWLDIRSDNVRRIMRERLDLAMSKDCDAVEPDNVTAFNNDTGFDLTASDQLDFNRFLADEAHARGLGVGLKNDLEQIPELVADFDFAVNEQCHEFDECDVYAPFIAAGKPVFSAEYADQFVTDAAARDAMCQSSRDLGLQTLVLPLDLDDSLRFSCAP